MQLQDHGLALGLRDDRTVQLSRLQQSVEHVGHLRALANQAQQELKFAEAWMWHCLMMMFGYGVRASARLA